MKRGLFAGLLAVGLVACNKNSVTAPKFVPVVTRVVITPVANQLEVGRTTTLLATVYNQVDSVMTDQTIAWASTAPAVATVNSAGMVSAVSKGSANIRAVVGTKSAISTVFVIDPTVANVSITGTVPSPFYVGTTLQANALVKDSGNNTLTAYAVTWTSSDTTIATVSSTGLITARRAGNTTITATAGGKSGTLSVTTTLVPVSTVSLAAAGPALKGRTIQISPTLKSSAGTTLTSTQRIFAWATTDSTVATIDNTGLLRGMSVGTTTVTCVVENKVGFINVVVSQVGISYVTVTPDSSNISVGGTRQLTALAFGADSVALNTTELDGRTFVWTSGNAATAVVSSAGLVTGIAAGNTTVTATIGPINKTAKVVVVP